MSENYQGGYHRWQIRLHWLTLILLVIVYATIELRTMAARGSLPGRILTGTHMSCGVLILTVMVIRLALRCVFKSPQITPRLHWLNKVVSWLGQCALYLLFIGLPVMGITSRYLHGIPWQLFGIPMPQSPHPDVMLSREIIRWHEIIALSGYWLIGLHAMAALAHQFLREDNALQNMLPRRWRRIK